MPADLADLEQAAFIQTRATLNLSTFLLARSRGISTSISALFHEDQESPVQILYHVWMHHEVDQVNQLYIK